MFVLNLYCFETINTSFFILRQTDYSCYQIIIPTNLIIPLLYLIILFVGATYLLEPAFVRVGKIKSIFKPPPPEKKKNG